MLSSFIREIKVLGQFRSHPDIIDLLGIAWEVSHGFLRPVLALEYAQHNSLSRFWSSAPTMLSFREKQKLCLDIASGIHALHETGFVWGDCKPENVLIFQDSTEMTAWKAKLNDFGGCVSREDAAAGFITYSSPWTAPEAHKAANFHALRTAELYSYGLLFWAIHMDGRHFSRRLWEHNTVGNDFPSSNDWYGRVAADEVEQLKRHDKLKDKIVEVFDAYLSVAITLNCLPPSTKPDTARVLHIIRQTIAEEPLQRWDSMWTVIQNIQMKGVASSSRDLRPLLLTSPPAIPTTTSCYLNDPEELDIEYLVGCYGSTTQLASVACAIFDRLGELRSPKALFKCGICSAIGFGTPQDTARAIEFLRESAYLGYAPAKGLYVVLKSGQTSHVPQTVGHDDISVVQDDLLIFDDFAHYDSNATGESITGTKSSEEKDAKWLWEAAVQGSPPATRILQLKDPEVYHAAIKESRISRGRLDYIHTKDPLHLAVASGDVDGLCHLLNSPGVDVEARSLEGETALLTAARLGDLSVVLALTEYGANVDAVDNKGATILHWLSFFNEAEIEKVQPFLLHTTIKNTMTKCKIRISPQYDGTLESGTPLDWAVDVRNLAATRAILKLGADAWIEGQGRPSALCRAAGRHDHEILSLLIEEEIPLGAAAISELDSQGMSCMAYALKPCFLMDRILINNSVDTGLCDVMQLLLQHQADISVINDQGDSALYSASKWQNALSTTRMCEMIATHGDLSFQITGLSGPNFWPPLRRALYSEDQSIFMTLMEKISLEHIKATNPQSFDGLTLLHELSFLPTDHGIACAKQLKDHGVLSSILHHRLPAYRQRGPLTAFQLAVLCHKFELADFLVSCGANPLRGINKARFLGYLLSYQLLDPAEISTFLFAILDDPVVNGARCFPPPSSVQPCVAYLLSHETQWWSQCRPPALLGRIFRSKRSRHWGPESKYEFDDDARYEPMIARKPGLLAVVLDAVGDPHPGDAHAVAESGYPGLLDTNEAGFGVRCLHAVDFGSFLIKYRRDGPTEQQYGHKYVTALELALDVVEKKPKSKEAEQIFCVILDFFRTPEYCNFPYIIYLPVVGRTFLTHLRRRETVLHRAIRLKKVAIVEKLLAANADTQMANINWQTPIHLANLLHRHEEPDLHTTRGSFLSRLIPASPARVTSITQESGDEQRILALLEAKEARRLWRPWSFLRAFLEVRWPWDEYDADDLGVRFMIFYFINVSFFVATIMLLTGVIGIMPNLLFAISEAYGSVLESLVPMGECFKECHANGSDPRALCTSLLFKPVSDLAHASEDSWYIPAFSGWVVSLMDAFSECYDDSVPSQTASNITGDFEHWMPGCDVGEILEGHPWIEGNRSRMDKFAEKFVRAHAKCECSWSARPRFKYKDY